MNSAGPIRLVFRVVDGFFFTRMWSKSMDGLLICVLFCLLIPQVGMAVFLGIFHCLVGLEAAHIPMANFEFEQGNHL